LRVLEDPMPVAFLHVEALVLREASSVLALVEAEHAHVFESSE